MVDRAYRLSEEALEAAEGQVDDEVHVFMTGGALGAYYFSVGVSVGVGFPPTFPAISGNRGTFQGTELDSFLSGWSSNASAYFLYGGGWTWNDAGIGTERGWGNPQLGASVRYTVFSYPRVVSGDETRSISALNWRLCYYRICMFASPSCSIQLVR